MWAQRLDVAWVGELVDRLAATSNKNNIKKYINNKYFVFVTKKRNAKMDKTKEYL